MDVGQKGRSKDTLGASFALTEGGIWLRENCWRFGFILRYDEGWEETTGCSYEPWHIRYVGLRHARAIHENPMPLEDYLQLLRTRRLTDALTAPESLYREDEP
jgi:D-alanyl-D-alanine carboxypeptidase